MNIYVYHIYNLLFKVNNSLLLKLPFNKVNRLFNTALIIHELNIVALIIIIKF